MTLLLIYYLNFKYGYSQAPELGDNVPREVRDRDYFYLWSFSGWSVWAALGLVYVWETIAALVGSESVRLGRETLQMPRRQSWLAASPVLALALVPLFANWGSATRAGDTTTRDFAADLLNSVEPYGVLVTVGDNDTFPLWYAQEVEGIRRDVVVANTSLLNTDWYTRQLIRQPVREYDAARGPAIYKNGTWKKPSGPPVNMTMEEADAIPLAYDMREPQQFVAGNIQATITPRTLTRADIFVLRMIKDNTGRPIYFSRTSGGYGSQELGLGPYLITQGLARKLVADVPRAGGRDTLLIPGEGFVDVGRTTALWDSVFLAPKSITKKGDWVDRASVGIPALYVSTGFMLSEAQRTLGNNAEAQKILKTAEDVARATRLSDLFNAVQSLPPLGAEGDSRGTTIPLPVQPDTGGKKDTTRK
jgi:hypothetical protein